MEFVKHYVDDATPVSKSLPGKVLGFDDRTLSLIHVISDEHEDRYGEVVEARGVRVTGHVPVLYGHGYSHQRGDVPVATMMETWVDTIDGVESLLARTDFYKPDEKLFPGTEQAREAGAFPATLYDMHKQRVLTGWSVGFRALGTAIVEVPAPTPEEPERVRLVRHFTAWELLEYSTVPVPANPHAVDKMAAAIEHGKLTLPDVAPWARQLGEPTLARLFPSLANPGNSPAESWLARLAKSANIETKRG